MEPPKQKREKPKPKKKKSKGKASAVKRKRRAPKKVPTVPSDSYFGQYIDHFQSQKKAKRVQGDPELTPSVMDMVIFRTIFFQLLVFFTFTLLTLHFAY